MTQRDMAGYLGIDVKTIRNWRKEKPNLYKTLMLGFAVSEIKEGLAKNIELIEQLQQLSTKHQAESN
jgi:hypothetical protein